MSQFIAKSLGGTVAAIALATAFTATGVAPAQAAGLGTLTPLFSGGGTLAELVYRDQFDCWGSNSSDIAPILGTVPTACTLTSIPFQPFGEALYAGVGSGNGKKAFTSNNAANLVSGARIPDAKPQGFSGDFGPFFDNAGVYPGLNDPYPHIDFAGSDDPLNTTDLSNYAASGLGAGALGGPPLQVPTLVTAIAIPFNPSSGGFTQNGKAPANAGAGTSLVDFSLSTYCGIFTGAITQWNDAAITTDNGNTVLGTGQITVVFRNDSSGTTFVTTNALINQCGTTAHPNKFSKHPIPDSWLTANSIPLAGQNSTAPFYTSNNSFYINVNAAAAFPAGSVFTGAKGSGGVQAAVEATAGSVAYLSPNFVQPVQAAPAPQAANLEDYKLAITNKSIPVFFAPAPAAATAAMSTAKVPSFSLTCNPATVPGGCATNPLNWGQVNPTPASKVAYPIAGFTFIDMYTCYADANTTLALATDTKSLLVYYFGSTVTAPSVNAILAADGFAPLPSAWKSSASKLLLKNAPTKIRNGASGSVCTGGV